MSVSSVWWQPHIHADRQPALRARARAATALRALFDAWGFVEVDVAALQVAPGADPHTHAFATRLDGPDGEGRTRYLHTSPEYACKKLLAAGETRIFSFGHVYRNGERSALHHPEFSLLEWYRADAPLDTLVDDCAAVLACAARAIGSETLRYREKASNPFAAIARQTVVDALRDRAGIDLGSALTGDAVFDRQRLAAATTKAGLRVNADDTWSDLFSKLLSQFVEPGLGIGAPCALTNYPAQEAALAALWPDDPRFAQRFELFACGVELANAFGELTDATEQRRRFLAENERRQAVYGTSHPLDPAFLDALALMPAASGIALGFDRLVMLLTGATHIEQVIWTPVAP